MAKTKKHKIDGRLIVGAVLLLAIIAMVWLIGRMLFGGKEKEQPEEEKQITEIEESRFLAQLQEQEYVREAELRGVSGYTVRGAAHMRITFSEYEMTMAASLPPLTTNERYEAWLLQPGVADYFSAGTFFPRADGWYGLTFTENLARIPAEPQTYTRILITRESPAEDNIPSNVRIAEGFFNL